MCSDSHGWSGPYLRAIPVSKLKWAKNVLLEPMRCPIQGTYVPWSYTT